MFTVDAHLDLAWNAIEWNRDLQQPIQDINAREKGLNDKPGRGNATVSLPELKKGNIVTLMAESVNKLLKTDGPF